MGQLRYAIFGQFGSKKESKGGTYTYAFDGKKFGSCEASRAIYTTELCQTLSHEERKQEELTFGEE